MLTGGSQDFLMYKGFYRKLYISDKISLSVVTKRCH